MNDFKKLKNANIISNNNSKRLKNIGPEPITVKDNEQEYVYYPDDLKNMKKAKGFKVGGCCVSIIAFGALLNYWNNNSNALINEMICISSAIVSEVSVLYGDNLRSKIHEKCRKK